jgi:hypothetical protein
MKMDDGLWLQKHAAALIYENNLPPRAMVPPRPLNTSPVICIYEQICKISNIKFGVI